MEKFNDSKIERPFKKIVDKQFYLHCNNHQSSLIPVFDILLKSGTLVDCTLVTESQYLKTQKVVLSACSPNLETLLSQHDEKHPIFILKDVKFLELKSLMGYYFINTFNIILPLAENVGENNDINLVTVQHRSLTELLIKDSESHLQNILGYKS